MDNLGDRRGSQQIQHWKKRSIVTAVWCNLALGVESGWPQDEGSHLSKAEVYTTVYSLLNFVRGKIVMIAHTDLLTIAMETGQS
jgi:hypothetical protein